MSAKPAGNIMYNHRRFDFVMINRACNFIHTVRYAPCFHKMTRQIIAVISFLVMILLISSISNAQECNELDDGRYKVKFKKLGYAAFEYILLIDNNTFIEYRDGKEFKGKIAENANCALRLDYLTNPDSLLGVQKNSRVIKQTLL